MDNIFTPISSNSKVDYVINQMKNLMLAGKIRPGDKLPSENELCENFNVSRGSLRTAMKVFEALGIVDIRAGDGTYVCTEISSNNLNPLIFSLLILNPGFNSFVQFREKIELDILDLIIKSPELTAKILPKLEDNLAEQYKLRLHNAPAEEFMENEREFHNIIAAGCDNVVFQTVYGFTFEFFWPYILESHRQQQYGDIAVDTHKQIFDAIKQGDFSLAKSAVDQSLVSWSNLVKEYGDIRQL